LNNRRERKFVNNESPQPGEKILDFMKHVMPSIKFDAYGIWRKLQHIQDQFQSVQENTQAPQRFPEGNFKEMLVTRKYNDRGR
jgi:hypothetical protein